MSSPTAATTTQSFLLLLHAIPLLSLPLSPLPLLVSLGVPFLALLSLAATVLVTRRLAILDAEAAVTECLLLRESARTAGGDPELLREIERREHLAHHRLRTLLGHNHLGRLQYHVSRELSSFPPVIRTIPYAARAA
ncbi:MAG: hypothetical protein DHS80DRAFT_21076 [Piptocephalis tieghemiana]|nr:MAG: hypothetical protein DHS80DRAFT_21076 [Piptocephalis tieghemiana]